MKTLFIALAITSASMTAFAGSGNDSAQVAQATSGQTSRVEATVKHSAPAPVIQSNFGERTYDGATPASFGKTRAQVMAETREAIRTGELRYVDEAFQRNL
ncbi:MAG: hypothetical protein V4562_02505 [Pseudomonadota bacterium]